MGFLKILFLIFLTFLVQTQVSVFSRTLNLAVVLVYHFGLRSITSQPKMGGYFSSRAEFQGTAFGAGIGLVEDILSGSIIGPAFLSRGLTGFLAVIVFTDVVYKWTPMVGVVTLAIITVLDGALVAGLKVLFTDLNIKGIAVLQILLIQVLVNIPFGIVLKPGNLD